MQATLHDLASNRDSPSFAICQRVLNRCHDIVFGDPPPPSTSTPYNSPAVIGRPTSRFWRKKVKPHLGPAIVGMGSVLAGSPGMPCLASISGKWAIDQGRKHIGDDRRPAGPGEDDDALSPAASTLKISDVNPDQANPSTDNLREDSVGDDDDDSPIPVSDPHLPSPAARMSFSGPMSHQEPTHTRTSSAGPSQTTPSLVPTVKIKRTIWTSDPFGQLEHPTPSSTPSIPTRNLPARSMTAPEPILHKYDASYQSLLLRSHYCKAEIKFLQTLESISNRLLVVPKPARVRAFPKQVLFMSLTLSC